MVSIPLACVPLTAGIDHLQQEERDLALICFQPTMIGIQKVNITGQMSSQAIYYLFSKMIENALNLINVTLCEVRGFREQRMDILSWITFVVDFLFCFEDHFNRKSPLGAVSV